MKFSIFTGENNLCILHMLHGPVFVMNDTFCFILIRWEDSLLYVGAYIQETNLWATFTQQDSELHRENDFEMLMDVDGSMFYYKQIQINVLGTIMDQVLINSPHDKGGGKYV